MPYAERVRPAGALVAGGNVLTPVMISATPAESVTPYLQIHTRALPAPKSSTTGDPRASFPGPYAPTDRAFAPLSKALSSNSGGAREGAHRRVRTCGAGDPTCLYGHMG